MKERMLVSLDGAVESLVTAWLLKKQGYQLRAVIFDISQDRARHELLRQKAVDFEKILGVQVQVIDCGKEAKEVIAREVKFRSARGFRYELKAIFHEKFIFPKLFALKQQYQFQKIASGHRIFMQFDPLQKKMQVFRYHTPEKDEAAYLLGLSQSQLSSLEFPLGTIHVNMIHKLAAELNFTADLNPVGYDILKPEPTIDAPDVPEINMNEIITEHHESSTDRSTILDMNPAETEIGAPSEIEREIREVWLENSSWFSGDDLGFSIRECAMEWKNAAQPVKVQIVQFEGGGMKAILTQPMMIDPSSLMSGDTVLLTEDEVILGGARVVKYL